MLIEDEFASPGVASINGEALTERFCGIQSQTVRTDAKTDGALQAIGNDPHVLPVKVNEL